jgi:hypothetical protein
MPVTYSCTNPLVANRVPQLSLPIGPVNLPDNNPVVVLIPRQPAGGKLSVILSATDIQIDACCDPFDIIWNAAAWDGGLWATNINIAGSTFFGLDSHVTALRFTNNTGSPAAQISVYM